MTKTNNVSTIGSADRESIGGGYIADNAYANPGSNSPIQVGKMGITISPELLKQLNTLHKANPTHELKIQLNIALFAKKKGKKFHGISISLA